MKENGHLDQSVDGNENHPSAETLVAYATGALANSKEEETRQHLLYCSDCRALAVDVHDFDNLPVSKNRVGVMEQAWLRLQAQREARAFEVTAPTDCGEKSTRMGSRRWVLFPVAAILLLAIILPLLLKSNNAPTANTFAISLDPSSQVVRDHARASKTISPQKGIDTLNITLTSAEPDFLEYRLRLADLEGRIHWETRRVSRQPSGAFKVNLPLRMLTAGSYEVVIFARNAPHQEQVLSRYFFTLNL